MALFSRKNEYGGAEGPENIQLDLKKKVTLCISVIFLEKYNDHKSIVFFFLEIFFCKAEKTGFFF